MQIEFSEFIAPPVRHAHFRERSKVSGNVPVSSHPTALVAEGSACSFPRYSDNAYGAIRKRGTAPAARVNRENSCSKNIPNGLFSKKFLEWKR